MPDSPVRRKSLFKRSRSPPKAQGHRSSFSDIGVGISVDQQINLQPKVFVQPPTQVSQQPLLPTPHPAFRFQPSLYLHPPERYRTTTAPPQPQKQRPEPLRTTVELPRPPTLPQVSLPQTLPPTPVSDYHPFLAEQAHHAQEARQTDYSPHKYCASTPNLLSYQPPAQSTYSALPPTPPPPPTIDEIRNLKHEIWTEVTRMWDPFYNHNTFPKHIQSVEGPLKNDEERMRKVREQMMIVKREVDLLKQLVKGDAASPEVGYGEGLEEEQWI